MSGVPPPAAAPAPKPAKRRSSKAKKTGPTVSDQILKVVAASKQRGGVSLVALKKGLAASGYDVAKNNARVKLAVRRLVSNGGLLQTKGTGASGSFKIGKRPVAKKKKTVKKKVKKPKKPKAKRAKRAKKATGAKAATSPKRKAKKKKAKRPKKAAAAKKPKSPRKAKRRVSRGKSKRAAAKKK